MTQEPQNQNTLMNLESFWNLLDSKLVSYGIPGTLVAVALDFARKSDWKNAGICVFSAGGVWLFIKIGKKISPYIDKLIDWIITVQIPKWWTKITDKFATDYLETLIAECQEYQGRGFSGEGLDLENVFVPLGFYEQAEFNSNPQDIIPDDDTETLAISNPQETEIGNLLKYVSQPKSAWRRLVILGAPGSGKTTLLRHITLLFALRKQSKLDRYLPPLIPILLRLRDIAPIIIADNTLSLAKVIAKAKKDESGKTEQWFHKQLKNGKCLVMLDGLDEIADDQERQQISTWVSQQLENYQQKLPFILTSRPQAYDQAPLPNTPAYLVRSFTSAQRNQFLFNWYFNLEKRRNSGKQSEKQIKRIAKSKTDELVRQIDAVASLRLMATNPLLLALINYTFTQKNSLSPTKIGIYKQVCDVLLQGRQSATGTTKYPLTPQQKQAALQALALEMTKHQALQFTLDEKNLDTHIFLAKDCLQAELTEMGEAGQKFTPENFIEKDDLGVRELLSDRKQEKLYEFTHRTFQEYLTSVELTKTEHQSDLLAVFTQDQEHLDWWRQTILFYAGQVKIDNLIDAALNNPTVANLTLAYECLQNKLRVSPDKEQQLLNKVEQGLQSDDVEVFKLAASVQLEKRLNYLNQDCFLGSEETEKTEDIWQGKVVDETEITSAEYRLFLLETTTNDLQKIIESNHSEIEFVKSNAFCAWLSERTKARFAEAGICYQREKATDTFRLVRFRVPEKYHQLAYYLAAGMWEEADNETLKVMLEVAGREKQGYLEIEDIEKFPCEDLRIIDQLWVNYSNGHFGFSVQKQIYLEVGGILLGQQTNSPLKKILTPFLSLYSRLGGKVRDEDEQIYEAYQRFGDRVEWKVNNKWIDNSLRHQVKYSTKAPRGHLPTRIPEKCQFNYKHLSSLASRLVNCNI
ncbi:GUN4 domain-containing protein [Anabaena sp. UHCC 0451]|uniref:GUN4 domain-containing protein n=1 Tax=Anabaena sp. UHCC 0451 TaxID=2055235 RepID=UPI002B201EE1|nr:GUN4 domain-containing protein [Anabaena sp. UHCC 0451]MEA5579121.1 GUN4 domain-containing protein [Anabaena sp. UHCC 0451]